MCVYMCVLILFFIDGDSNIFLGKLFSLPR